MNGPLLLSHQPSTSPHMTTDSSSTAYDGISSNNPPSSNLRSSATTTSTTPSRRNRSAAVNTNPATPTRIASSSSRNPRLSSSSLNNNSAQSKMTNTAPATAPLSQTTPDPRTNQPESYHPLMDHLYEAFLKGSCSDVFVRVEQWGLGYRLHRVVLVQAGFFHSLWLGGFSEGESSDPSQRRRQGSVETGYGNAGGAEMNGTQLNLTFDDANITRAAFEICISRLYSRHPSLHLASSLTPSPSHPLTPSFPLPPLIPIPSTSASLPPFTQSSSPRLLLSLLATSIYLGQNDLVRESLGLILGSVTPWSVGRYLGFAVGRGCGEVDVEDEDAEAASGMEGLGRQLLSNDMIRDPRKGKGKGRETRNDDEEEEGDIKPDVESLSRSRTRVQRNSEDLDDAKVCEVRSQAINHTELEDSTSSTHHHHQNDTSFSTSSSIDHQPNSATPYFYGFAGDKIGEACAAWLSRWGQDLLEVEEAQCEALMRGRGADKEKDRNTTRGGGLERFSGLHVGSGSLASDSAGGRGSGGSGGSSSRSRDGGAKSISLQLDEGRNDNKPTLFRMTDAPFRSTPTPNLSELNGLAARRLCIWGHGGLPAVWVRAIISSDQFFIENELERYRFAKRVMELRRLGKETNSERRNIESDIAVKEEEEIRNMEIDDEEETDEAEEEAAAEMAEIFASGIHFSHMTFEELSSMSSDINPETGHPYVPMAVLQSALWGASDLKNKISTYKPDGTYTTPIAGSPLAKYAKVISSMPIFNVDHGLAVTTADIVQAVEAALKPPTPRFAPERSTSPRLYGLSKDVGNSSFSSSAVSPPSLGGTVRGGRFPSVSSHQPHASPVDQLYWPVPVDNTVRIGDAASQAAAYMPFHSLPDLGPGNLVKPGKADSRPKTGESNFFGFASSARNGKEIFDLCEEAYNTEIKADGLWSRHEPFRFSVEFWDVEGLGEKERAYSKTVFHAGSYFNIYVQTLKKKDKGVQLGIYLHRQSMLEPLPAASKPRAGATRASSPLGWNASLPALNQAHPPGGTPATALGMQRTMSIPTMTTAMLSTSPPSQVMMNEDEMPAEENMSTSPASPKSPPLNRNAPMSPYRDPRKVARVYFSVSCASAMGTALTRFSSGPDQFAVSQSWGWRSSSLRSQEYLAGSGPENHGPSLNERLESGVLGWISDVDEDWSKKNLHSLRASVVLGVL